MTLYEIDKNINDVIERGFAVDEDGVITFDETDLDNLQTALETKLESIALYIKNTEAEANAIKIEEQMLAERRKAKENKAKRLTDYMTAYLMQRGQKKFETPRVVASIRTSEQVIVDDPDTIPDEYATIKTERKPDKKMIKLALKSGMEIAGAKLVVNQNLNIK